MSGLRPLDESQWLGFKKTLMGNSWGIVGILIPNIRIKMSNLCFSKLIGQPYQAEQCNRTVQYKPKMGYRIGP